MFQEVRSLFEFEALRQSKAVLTYFSTAACSVCKVLKPKIAEMCAEHFPELSLVYVRSDVLPEIAGQYRVFAAPTIVVFFEGRETVRKSRAIGVDKLRQEIERYYRLLFDE